METRYLILARYAEFTSDGRLNLLGGDSNQFVAESYPYVLPMLVAASRTVFNRADAEREHEFRTVLVAEDTDEVIAEGANGTIPKFTVPPDAKYLGTGFILTFTNIIFPREGRYLVKVLIDDKVMATAPLKVAPLAHFPGMLKVAQEDKPESSENGSNDRGADQ